MRSRPSLEKALGASDSVAIDVGIEEIKALRSLGHATYGPEPRVQPKSAFARSAYLYLRPESPTLFP